MNEFSNEVSAMPEGLSAVSMEELNKVEGGFFWLIAIGAAVAFGAANHNGEGTGTLKAIHKTW